MREFNRDGDLTPRSNPGTVGGRRKSLAAVGMAVGAS
ncbi:hypothetical protein EUA03_05350 [Mycolicibacterium mucogenicum]|uniref:Uncharacterized protein n=1 Tax=Mycolicibacterium mucogenicum TaxID=56689 RepID=A0A4R5WMS6_MYCMU|nr:hypothetical protein EUA03_05350 [Mycolicibacterium mucogenicum]